MGRLIKSRPYVGRLVVLLLTMELLLAISIGQTAFLHRKDFQYAVVAWHQNPTLENQRELERQKHLNKLHRWGMSAVAFTGMAVVTVFAVHVSNLRRRSDPGQ